MSIDFSQVKTITIPEGSVTKITDSNGNILWQGVQSKGWHTIWEGNKTITSTKSGTANPVVSGETLNLAKTAIGKGTKPKLRITFSCSNTNTDPNWNNGFRIGSSFMSESAVLSPFITELTSPIANNICCVCCRHKDGDSYVYVFIGVRKKLSFGSNPDNNITINLSGQSSPNNTSYSGDFTLTFTVTKIEQYY